MRTGTAIVFVLFSVVLLACGDGASPGAPLLVRTDVRTLVDRTRATPSNAEFTGAPERTLETRIWLTSRPLSDRPACAGERCALVLLAHGFGGSTARFEAIARGLARAGYVVAAPSFPLTNDRAPGGHVTGLGDTTEQPADLSFVIDELLAASADPADALLAGRVDPERIAVLGHSLGAVTAIALSRVPGWRDRRVDAVVLVAPVTALVEALFGESHGPRGPPTLAMSGSEDTTVPPGIPAAFYDSIEAPRVHLLLTGANHVDLIETFGTVAPVLEVSRRAIVAFLDYHLGGAADLPAVLEDLRRAGHTVRYDLG